jgi:DnaJ-class molecular chaperone
MSTDPRQTHYRTLMLAEIADDEIISAVYRKLAQRYHPDVDASPDAAQRMKEINEAYATLRDPEKRRKYDHWLVARRDRRRNDHLIVQQSDVGVGSAGAPVGPAHGSVLAFGRYQGWSLGQIRRADPEYLEWLVRAPIGQRYRPEIAALLRK